MWCRRAHIAHGVVDEVDALVRDPSPSATSLATVADETWTAAPRGERKAEGCGHRPYGRGAPLGMAKERQILTDRSERGPDGTTNLVPCTTSTSPATSRAGGTARRGTDVAPGLLLGRPSVGIAADGGHAAHHAWSCVPAPTDRAALTAWLHRAPPGVVRVKGLVASPAGEHLVGQRVGRRVEVTRHRGAEPHEATMTVVGTEAADDDWVERWLAEL